MSLFAEELLLERTFEKETNPFSPPSPNFKRGTGPEQSIIITIFHSVQSENKDTNVNSQIPVLPLSSSLLLLLLAIPLDIVLPLQ